ncbi:MAG: hypothetical protein ACKOET_12710 [Verrucomicrobiota bacterium]
MNLDSCCSERIRTVLAYFAGVLGTFLIVGFLAWLVVRPGTEAPDAARAAARLKARQEIEAATAADLGRFAVDPNKENLARLGIDRAIEVLVAEWKDDAAAGRAKLLERLESSKKTASFE